MKKVIVFTILAMALGFITGFYFRDYCIQKKTEIKGQAIEKNKTTDNDTIQSTLYNKENNWKNPECYEWEDFGPV